MTDITCTQATQADPMLASDTVFTQTVSRSQPPFDRTQLAPFGILPAGTIYSSLALPSLAAMAEELRRLQLLCAAQARRLDDLEAREHLSWPTRSAYAHLEIDP